MSHANPSAHTQSAHVSRRTYLIGFLLSVVLTALPFWMVMRGGFDPTLTVATIMAAAVVQILVHTVCFLHVNTSSEGGWTLLAYIFTAVLVLIVISGSLWIMYHLNANMMLSTAAAESGS